MKKYESLPRTNKEKAAIELETAQGEQLCMLLPGLSEINDWIWAQEQYLRFLRHSDKWVSSAAINGLGHLARLNGTLDKKRVVQELTGLKKDRPDLEGKIADVLSDIDMFVD